MNITMQRACTWSGPLFTVLFFVGFWVIAGLIPPPPPSQTAEEVAQTFRENANSIRAGLLLTMYSGVFTVPWVAAISVQMKRIEGHHTPLTYTQLGLGVLLPIEFIAPIYFWQAAAYRPERSAESIQMLNDLGWLPFAGLVFTIVLQAVVLGIAVLSDKRNEPIFPRWFGYFSICSALLFCPAALNVFVKDGPLAWNGLIAWWLLLVAFFVWVLVVTGVLLRAASIQQRDEPTAASRLFNTATERTV